jgi:tetratricopeptide (TPR) repeat protein
VSVFTELKRRNVFKVGAAYAVIAWLAAQVADVFFPAFGFPIWILQALLVVLVLGLPVAIVLAWIYDLTPEGMKRTDDVSGPDNLITSFAGRKLALGVTGVAILIGGIALANYLRLAAEARLVPNSIAVLDFTNRSLSLDDDYLANGLGDELRRTLGRITELSVASGVSSSYFRGKNTDIRTISESLNVDTILNGSVQRGSDRISVTVELVDGESGYQLWSETYDRSIEEILLIQAEIVRAVTSEIAPVLLSSSVDQLETSPTQSLEAYDFYLLGREKLRQPGASSEKLSSARASFDRAISLDPRFAHAYAGLCQTYLESYESTLDTTQFEQAEIACHRAVTLNESLSDVYVSLGNLYRVAGQHDRAIAELETAVAARPNSAGPYLELGRTYWEAGQPVQAEASFREAMDAERGDWSVYSTFASFLYDQERFSEALQFDERVVRLTPDNSRAQNNVGLTYWVLGDLARAEEAFSNSISIEPNHMAYTNLGLIAYYQAEFERSVEMQTRAVELAPDDHRNWGRLAESNRFIGGAEDSVSASYQQAINLAERQLTINPTDWETVGLLGLYYAYSDRLSEARNQIDEMLALNSTSGSAHYFAALFSLYEGDVEETYEHLGTAIELGFPSALIANDPDLAALRGDGRYEEIVAL